jgi:hypothetical protein
MQLKEIRYSMAFKQSKLYAEEIAEVLKCSESYEKDSVIFP